MPIEEIVSANLVPFIGLVILFIFILKNTLFNRRQTILFILAISVNLILIVAKSLDFIFAESAVEGIYIFRRITSFLNFSVSPLMPFLMLLIARPKKLHWSFWMPLILNFILCFISIFVKIIFYITLTNKYGRGVLFFIPFMTTLFYLFALIVILGKSHSRNRLNERIFLLSVIFLLSLCMFLEIQQGFLFLIWDATAIILILYYLLLNIQNLMLDSLTGCYNRQTYQRALENINRKERVFVAILDINNFKMINDLYGHDEGDRKLIKFVEILHSKMVGIAKVYRFGGDEFVLISKKNTSATLVSALELVRIAGEQFNITFACGVVEYRPSDDIQDVMRQADNIMYANKTQIKSAMENQHNTL